MTLEENKSSFIEFRRFAKGLLISNTTNLCKCVRVTYVE